MTTSEMVSITRPTEAAATSHASMLIPPTEVTSPVIEIEVDLGLPFLAELIDEVSSDKPKSDKVGI